uniref:Uncharacterized protein n=1 Tax=Anguilla anguilla TaxID=7936 RepID=A0A0E9WA21_ANGAN
MIRIMYCTLFFVHLKAFCVLGLLQFCFISCLVAKVVVEFGTGTVW